MRKNTKKKANSNIQLLIGVVVIVIILVVVFINIPTQNKIFSVNEILQNDIVRITDFPILWHGDSGSWDGKNIGCSQLIDINGQTRMYYLGQSIKSDTCAIGFAYKTSGDLQHWEKYKNNPVIVMSSQGWESSYGGLFFGSIIKVDDMYYLYYSSFYDKSLGNRAQIGVAFSTDGVNWRKYRDNPIVKADISNSEYHCAYPYVIKIGKLYYMYYSVTSKDVWWACDQYRVAVSEDGLNWTKKGIVLEKGNNVSDPDYGLTESCMVYPAKDGYVMCYSAAGVKEWTICFASSPAPTELFVKSSRNPVLVRNPVDGKFDSEHIATGYITSLRDKCYLIYQGGKTINSILYFSLGLAEIK